MSLVELSFLRLIIYLIIFQVTLRAVNKNETVK